ncbi:MAG: hypothetical protein U0X73_17435 [Thermoanaerobaculia bacterium]
MFEWWKDVLRPIRMEDRDFGQMRYLRQTSTWECQSPFDLEGGTVEVLIEGEAAGPSAAQRQRWRELPEHYSRLRSEAVAAIGRIIADQRIENFEFRLAAVCLPDALESSPDLELTFGNISGPPQFDAEVSSWRIRQVVGPR